MGFAVWRLAVDEAEILMIAVDPQHIRMGVGAKLLQQMLTNMKEAGCVSAYLEVSESNEAARRLYAAAHFKFVARRDY